MDPDSYIGRVVAFIVMPFVLVLTGVIAKYAQAKFGVDLDDEQVTWIILASILGVGAVGYRWLKNRGLWEVVNAGKSYTQMTDEQIEDLARSKRDDRHSPGEPTLPVPPSTPQV